MFEQFRKKGEIRPIHLVITNLIFNHLNIKDEEIEVKETIEFILNGLKPIEK